MVGGQGTITLRDIRGVFLTGELLLDSNNGAGRVSGQTTYSDAALDPVGVGVLRAPAVTGSAGYAVTMDTISGQVRVRLAGAAGHIVEWTVEVTITEP